MIEPLITRGEKLISVANHGNNEKSHMQRVTVGINQPESLCWIVALITQPYVCCKFVSQQSNRLFLPLLHRHFTKKLDDLRSSPVTQHLPQVVRRHPRCRRRHCRHLSQLISVIVLTQIINQFPKFHRHDTVGNSVYSFCLM